jgi:thiamine pyrophosphate-dependent acetolactate synthase large subunit-like protein
MTLKRADVLLRISDTFPANPIVLTLGGTVREMIAVAGRRPNHLANLDAMGHTVGVAFGLALGLRGPAAERVLAVEGDGSLLMGLSVVGTIGHRKPANLVVFVLDNGVYLATGGQPTASADIDLVAVALACGWAGGREVRTGDELAAALDWAAGTPGPLLVRVFTSTEQIKTGYFLEDPAVLAEDFRRWLRDAGSLAPDGSR